MGARVGPVLGAPLVMVLAIGWLGSSWGADIAGTAPGSRPEAAPRVVTVDKSGGWYDKALTGIERPYPYSLRFLDDQGNWYTPFSRPGMIGRYDIRGWHSQKNESQ